jgi:hypothetical protein
VGGSRGVGEPDEIGESDARDRVVELVRANEAEGVRPDGWTARAPWKTERDIPDEVLFAAMEAVL